MFLLPVHCVCVPFFLVHSGHCWLVPFIETNNVIKNVAESPCGILLRMPYNHVHVRYDVCRYTSSFVSGFATTCFCCVDDKTISQGTSRNRLLNLILLWLQTAPCVSLRWKYSCGLQGLKYRCNRISWTYETIAHRNKTKCKVATLISQLTNILTWHIMYSFPHLFT